MAGSDIGPDGSRAQCGEAARRAFHRERTRASIERRTSVCGWCGVGFVARGLDRLSYCSRQCGAKAVGAEKRRRSAKAAESARPFTPVRFGACIECDKPIVARIGRIVCSRECAKERAKAGARARTRAVFRPMQLSCAECGKSHTTEYGKAKTRFCSNECARRAAKRTSRKRERARLRLVMVESVDPLKVFDRDGWRCRCCRKPTPRDKRGTYHPRAPELDHIIPLAKGGEHSYRNTQLLCRACNWAKSDTDGGQQLRLFG
jgi:5-methylcytosine-specific restriction endonuclease McrA